MIEEIEALENEQQRRVSSFLRQLLIHLLLYQYWESERDDCKQGWKVEIRNFRAELDDLVSSATLYNHLLEQYKNVYSKARKIAIDKTGLSSEIFPLTCPFSHEQIVDAEFFPE